MRRHSPAELIVGSVQLGLAYGAANRTGKPSRETALGLVRGAADASITASVTARGRRVRTITKFSPLTELKPEAPQAAVLAYLDRSIRAFGQANAADLCLGYVRDQDWIDGVVVGMETKAQLEANPLLGASTTLGQADCAVLVALPPTRARAIARSRPMAPR
jgi:hypothetical protein